MKKISRRETLKSLVPGAMVLSMPTIIPRSVFGANDRIRVAVIGHHGRGKNHIQNFMKLANVELATLCDVDDEVNKKGAAEFEKTTGKKYLDDAQLVNSLKLHIGLFIKRAKRGIETSNQIIAEIKKNLPVEFDLAALMGIQIEKSFNVQLSESEIGFLTLHFASYEERRKSKERKKILDYKYVIIPMMDLK